MHIALSGVPVLSWEPPPMTSNIMAKEVMSYPVSTLNTLEKVGRIVDLLTQEPYHGFPIVKDEDEVNSLILTTNFLLFS